MNDSTAKLGDFEVGAARCPKCGDIEIDPDQMQLVLGHRKLADRGVVETSVRGPSGSGKSMYLRLPPEVANNLLVDPEHGAVIEPLQPGIVAVRLHPDAVGIRPADDAQKRAEAAQAASTSMQKGEPTPPQGQAPGPSEPPQDLESSE